MSYNSINYFFISIIAYKIMFYRRNAPRKIPPIIHQIWLSEKKKISRVNMVLRNTLV